ncbi:MAG TPA: ergothioneine biosynthesis protein EgtB [Allosphingosinicella sp.]|nr:ergothioneine biosynthesis protein EgtB [Allosphingosinicella sp.]
MATQADPSPDRAPALAHRYRSVRALSEAIAEPLSDADATLQPMPDASPAKWHLAHGSWFFETFVLRDHLPGHRLWNESWAYLFNSYYEGEGERQPRERRGMLSRPSLDEIRAWRTFVDEAVVEALPRLGEAALGLVELGLNHEQQHQELMLMDLTVALAENPLGLALWPAAHQAPAPLPSEIAWVEGLRGLTEIGHCGAGFAFDSEGPRHQALLHPHALADRLITNNEWLCFIGDGGYSRPELWMADGWAWVAAHRIEAPLHWRRGSEGWSRFALDGLRPLAAAEPVAHISWYEADAYARWAGARLPREDEWEAAAAGLDPSVGTQLDRAGPVRPRPAPPGEGLRQMYGDLWEWTMSDYAPYPGFRPQVGTVGEYNGKFMCNQFVLRGGSCATPRGHLRQSYRNFFYPHQRWMYSGLRLARDL